jgi:hypothetical protein
MVRQNGDGVDPEGVGFFDFGKGSAQEVDVLHQETISIAFGESCGEKPGGTRDAKPSVFSHCPDAR